MGIESAPIEGHTSDVYMEILMLLTSPRGEACRCLDGTEELRSGQTSRAQQESAGVWKEVGQLWRS